MARRAFSPSDDLPDKRMRLDDGGAREEPYVQLSDNATERENMKIL